MNVASPSFFSLQACVHVKQGLPDIYQYLSTPEKVQRPHNFHPTREINYGDPCSGMQMLTVRIIHVSQGFFILYERVRIQGNVNELTITLAAHVRTHAADSLFPASTSAVRKIASSVVPRCHDVPDTAILALQAIWSKCNKATIGEKGDGERPKLYEYRNEPSMVGFASKPASIKRKPARRTDGVVRQRAVLTHLRMPYVLQ